MSKRRIETGVRSFVTFRLARVQAKLNAQASAVLGANSDLSLTEWRVLSLVVASEETTAAGVARDVQMDKAQVSRAVKSLSEEGLVATKIDPRDNRQTLLAATDKGEGLFERLVSIMRRRQAWLTKDLATEDLETFQQVLSTIEDAATKREF